MDVGEAGLQGQIAWFELLAAQGFTRLDLPGGTAVATGLGSNTENGAVLAGRAGAAEAVAWLRDRDLPASVLLRQADAPATELLRSLGLEPEGSGKEMGAALDALRLDAAAPRDVQIREVRDPTALAAALGVFRDDGWYEEDGDLDRRVEAARQVGFGPGTAVRHWLATDGSSGVGAATSFAFGSGPARTVVLAHCCVARLHRRRGIGTALTRARLGAARADGVRYAVLSPSPDGYELQRSLGFTPAPTPPDRWFYLR